MRSETMLEGQDELRARASAELHEGAFEEATASFTEVIQRTPECAEAYRGRALAQFQLKRWAAAQSDFARSRELDPNDRESWLGLGMSLAMAHEIYPAIDVLETLLERHPDFVRGHLQLGLFYYRLCITAKGRRHLELALALRPTLAERRMIERVLDEQRQLDTRRYYRPDFEALRATSARRSGSPVTILQAKFSGRPT